MKINLRQLDSTLKHGVLPMYWVSGDEILLKNEALDKIRTHLNASGFVERERFTIEHGFNWQDIAAALQAMSLFSSQKIIELEFQNGKLLADGQKIILPFLSNPTHDRIIIASSPKLESGQTSGKWYKLFSAAGLHLAIWPLKPNEFEQWILQNLRRYNLTPAAGVVKELAKRFEGNLVGASNEIILLSLLCDGDELTLETVEHHKTVATHHSVFDLCDSCLSGKLAQSLTILDRLQAQGVEGILILWALAKDTRQLLETLELKAQHHTPQSIAQRLRILPMRTQLWWMAIKRLPPETLKECLIFCQVIDQSLKGGQDIDPWYYLNILVASLASGRSKAIQNLLQFERQTTF